ncbi:hypothetical protein DS901_05255 [Loktanella sp. D2R18]|uniref:DUF1638 domain-containing protein n=1 Tax=Rhodobacterales TaxID=204455 RepID=UPI000DE93F60|nr:MULTISPECIES: DUF1638 domain-containing protein [Rhodobacterales]MDO6590731.1 DUF1638 domain-containing protein [Yoonia sp. 1_MG-2023]RBW44650.1 hypothetical protein DS901_05255 [Loktanella sp. D2R18]
MTTDATLTHDGLTPDGCGRVLLIACGALAREIIALRKGHGWDHLDLQCLPAIYHSRPEKIEPAVRQAVTQYRDHYDRIFVVYADCGTGGQLQATCDEMGVKMIAGPHCYSFYEGNDAFATLDEVTSFYLTDFLVRQFDAFVWEPLGLSKHPQLRDMYFGNYEKLVYQAQVKNPELVEKARECADRLGLEFEYRFTGYGDLKRTLQTL